MEMEKAEFRRRVKLAWSKLGSIDEMCRRAQCSRPTMMRWLDGVTCPHPVARESAIRALEAPNERGR